MPQSHTGLGPIVFAEEEETGEVRHNSYDSPPQHEPKRARNATLGYETMIPVWNSMEEPSGPREIPEGWFKLSGTPSIPLNIFTPQSRTQVAGAYRNGAHATETPPKVTGMCNITSGIIHGSSS